MKRKYKFKRKEESERNEEGEEEKREKDEREERERRRVGQNERVRERKGWLENEVSLKLFKIKHLKETLDDTLNYASYL